MSDVPTYIRPKLAHVDPGGTDWGGLVLIAAAIAAVGGLVLFIAAHLVLLAACTGAFVAVMSAVIVVFRRAASPRRWAEYRYPKPPVTIPAPRPARALPAPRPRAIEAPRAVTEPSPHVNRDAVPRVP